MGAFSLKDRSHMADDLAMVFRHVPTPEGTPQPEGGYAFRRRTADAGDGPRADEPSEDDPHGRAVHGPVPRSSSRRSSPSSASCTSRTSRFCWSSRTPRWRCRSPTAHTCWKPAVSRWKATPRNCSITSRCARRIWAPDSCRIRLVGLDASKPTGLFLYPMEYSPVVFPPFGRAIEPCLTIGKLTG